MSCIYFETVLNDFVYKKLRRKIYFLSCPRHCDRGLIVVRVYYIPIWNKKENIIIIIKVIRSHMGPMYIETPYIAMYI